MLFHDALDCSAVLGVGAQWQQAHVRGRPLLLTPYWLLEHIGEQSQQLQQNDDAGNVDDRHVVGGGPAELRLDVVDELTRDVLVRWLKRSKSRSDDRLEPGSESLIRL